jgi:hypothetical protein
MIEVGAGNGPNFPHYPHSVTEVVAVEPEPFLASARSRRHESPGVTVTAGFVIGHYDAFVFRPFPLTLPTAPHILGTARRPAD